MIFFSLPCAVRSVSSEHFGVDGGPIFRHCVSCDRVRQQRDRWRLPGPARYKAKFYPRVSLSALEIAEVLQLKPSEGREVPGPADEALESGQQASIYGLFCTHKLEPF